MEARVNRQNGRSVGRSYWILLQGIGEEHVAEKLSAIQGDLVLLPRLAVIFEGEDDWVFGCLESAVGDGHDDVLAEKKGRLNKVFKTGQPGTGQHF